MGRGMFLISIPKSGTNMIDQMLGTYSAVAYVIKSSISKAEDKFYPVEEVLREMNNPPIQFVRSHLLYSKEYEEVLESYNHVFFLYRDFRDCIISSMFWDARTNAHQKPHQVKLSEEQIDQLLFVQMEKWRPIYFRFSDWLDVPWIHKLKYEDFILDSKTQTERLVRIINGSNSPAMMKMVGSRQSNTFRKGTIGDWKDYFKPHHLDIFWDYFGDLMERFGYE